MVNNMTIPLYAASPSQLIAQLPFSVVGSATVVVRVPGAISDPFAFTVQATAPAIFQTGSNGTQNNLSGGVPGRQRRTLEFAESDSPGYEHYHLYDWARRDDAAGRPRALPRLEPGRRGERVSHGHARKP